jgi:very-short-patch-repair endonuclease
VREQQLVKVYRSVYGRHPLTPHAPHLISGDVVDEAYLRAVHAALLSAGPSAVACGRTAAVVWRLDMLVEPRVVELAVPRGRSRSTLAGVVSFQRDCVATAVTRGGLRVTPPIQTLGFCARTRPSVEAVALVDSALRRRLVTIEELAAGARRGSALHRAVVLADPRSGSVLESALRVLLAQHGLAPPEAQYVIRGGGRFVARVDFCWPALRLIVEADGRRWHDPEDARTFDRRRANECASYGWRVLRFTWAEVLHEPAYVVACVRRALAAAA